MAKGAAASEELLTKYKDQNHLNNRIRFYQKYGTSERTWFEWVHDNIEFQDSDRILEIGCGVGHLWDQNEEQVTDSNPIILSDLSNEMTRAAKTNLCGHPQKFTFSEIDGQKLPFKNNSFDIIIANHVLFLIPDLRAVLKEILRVLNQDGTFYASTTGHEHLKEIKNIVEFVVGNEIKSEKKFTLDNGGMILSEYFENIQIERFDDFLVFDHPDPIERYLRSKTYCTKKNWEDISYEIRRVFENSEQLKTKNDVGMFVCCSPKRC